MRKKGDLFQIQLLDRGEELFMPRDRMRALPEYLKMVRINIYQTLAVLQSDQW